jgi:putative transposase
LIEWFYAPESKDRLSWWSEAPHRSRNRAEEDIPGGKRVESLGELDRYPYSGHSAIMGFRKRQWQEVQEVLGYFGQREKEARRKYREYVEEGALQGRRRDLVGGGLIRSLGGWEGVQGLGRWRGRFKGDERILGGSEFVREVLKASEEAMERRYGLKAKGIDLERIIGRVGELFGMRAEEIKTAGKSERELAARSVVSYWAVREVGVSGTEVARRLGVTQPAVSQAVKRGARIIERRHLKLKED